jgi:hypothetical protein
MSPTGAIPMFPGATTAGKYDASVPRIKIDKKSHNEGIL